MISVETTAKRSTVLENTFPTLSYVPSTMIRTSIANLLRNNSIRAFTSTSTALSDVVPGIMTANPNLKNLEGDDYLYHIGLNPKEDDLQKFFHDVKFVCMGGSVGRMEEFAQSVADELGKFVIFLQK